MSSFSVSLSQQALPFLQKAQTCMQTGDYHGAIAALTRVINIEGKNEAAAYAYHSRAVAYAAMDSFPQAINDWTQALTIVPNGGMAIDIHMMRASVSAQIGNIEAAISDVSRVIAMSPTYPEAYNRRAQYRMQKQDFVGAVADLSRAIGLDQQNYVYYLNRGQARQGMLDFENALLDFNQAVRLEPRDADNYFFRGALYQEMNRLDEALKDMNEAVRLDSSESPHFSRRGQIKASLGDFDGAILDFNQALRLNPSSAPNLNRMLSEVHAWRSLSFEFGSSDAKYNFEQSLVDAETAIRLQPGSPIGYCARGRIRLQDDMRYIFPKQFTESARLALVDFGKAIQIAPDFPEPYADRASILQKYGRLRDAFEDMKVALRLRPNQPYESAWLMRMQMIVNELADDGYTAIDMGTLIFGKPGYNELTQAAVHDWDHYLAWRLQSRAMSTSSVQLSRAEPVQHQSAAVSIPKASNADDGQQRPVNKEESDKFQELGLRHKREGNYAASKDAYRKAIQLNYADSMAYYALAKTCYLNENGREAILNYLAALHLSLGNMLQSLSNPDQARMLIEMRNMLAKAMGAETLMTVQLVHPHADLLWLDENTPRHLAHALIDLNPHVKKSRKLNQHIQMYMRSLKGDNSVTLDDRIESKHYLQIGRMFAYENLRWSKLDIRDPYSLYSTKDQLVVEGVRKSIANLP